jgi:gamma-glutamyl:cysteine ligase YbdK (ATP-grasp superfamily)
MKHAVVEDECKKLVPADRKDLPWVDLMVKRKEFKARLKDMRASALEQPKFKTLRDSISSALGVGYEVKEDPLHQRILKEIASGDGSLEIINFLEGVSYTVRSGQHQRHLNNGNDPKEIAELEDSVEELEQKHWIRLVNQTANGDRFYKVTGDGYKEAGQ